MLQNDVKATHKEMIGFETFIKRKNLSKWAVSNIKCSRSAVNTDVINKYFDELEATSERLVILLRIPLVRNSILYGL